MKTVIMAGGRGTRISSIAQNIPKPMVKIRNKPVLEHEIECLHGQGFTDIIITVSYLGDVIMDYFGEKEPLGNAGALFKLKDKLEEDFLLLNADVVFDIDFNRFVNFHKSHKGLVTLFTHPNSHPYDSGLIIAGKDGSVEAWLAKEDVRPQWYHNRVNGGLHVISPQVLYMSYDSIEIQADKRISRELVKIDLDRHILKPLAGTGKMLCYDSPEYVKDMGTPERYKSVCAGFEAGLVKFKNLKISRGLYFLTGME